MASRLPKNSCFQVWSGRARTDGSMEGFTVRLERGGRRDPGSWSRLIWLLPAAFLLLLPSALPAEAQNEPRVIVTVTPAKAKLSPGDTLQYKAVADFGHGS